MTRWTVPVLAISATVFGFIAFDRDAASAATVDGKLLRENAGPIPFADIRACPEGADKGCFSTVSDSEGAFRLDVPEGRYEVRTTLPNGTEFDSPLNVGRSEERMEIVVPR